MDIRSLENTPLHQIVDCFNAAFADYMVPMQVDVEQMQWRWRSCRVDYGFSYGAFDGEKLVGIMITGVDQWQGRKTAYNSGTGVIPDYRGRRIVQQLYNTAIPHFRAQGIEQCTLEVIVGNERAMRAYERVGFQPGRRLRCFSRGAEVALPVDKQFRLQRAEQPDWGIYAPWQEFEPSWENQPTAVKIPDGDSAVWELCRNHRIVGYIALRPEAGQVLQFGVTDALDWKQIGQQLWQHAFSIHPKMRINNVEAEDERSLAILESMGMSNTVDQWEMIWML